MIEALLRAATGVVDACGAVARWATLALTLLVAANVLLRYLFSVGTVGLQELEWHLVSPIALLGMAYAMRHGAHVRVDYLYDKLPEAGRHGVDLAAAALTVAFSGIVIALAVPYVQQAYALGEGSPDPGGLPHRFLLKSLIPLGFAVLALQGLANLLEAGRGLRAALRSRRP